MVRAFVFGVMAFVLILIFGTATSWFGFVTTRPMAVAANC